MPLKLIKGESFLSPEECQFSELNNFCSSQSQEFTFEWIDGQFWLHSDKVNENPIGIEIDRTLSRHEEYLKKSSVHKELLAKAVGVKGSFRPKVLDLTAGMLGDSLLLLSFGCEVWASERHPIINFLILSALQNATHPKIQFLHYQHSEAIKMLSQELPLDTIYFDPMFEDVNDKTLPKKEMRIFREVIGQDQDASFVLDQAIKMKPKRVVVKRPRHSSVLGRNPDVQYIGKSTRYDVYFSV